MIYIDELTISEILNYYLYFDEDLQDKIMEAIHMDNMEEL